MAEQEGYHVMIRDSVGFESEVVIYEVRMGAYFLATVKDGYLEFNRHEKGSKITPTLILDPLLIKILLTTLSRMGIKTKNESTLEGTLEAQRYHLEDLRKILKLDKTSEEDSV